MSAPYDVILVSAFGRGNWLASELSRQASLKVCLIDVSEQFGRWSAEDWEGPFGIFQSENLSQTQLGRLSHDDYSDLNPQGLTLWLKNGPVDFMGPITQFWLETESPLLHLKKYLVQWESSVQSSDQLNLVRSLQNRTFDKSWMIHFAHQWASTQFHDNAHGAEQGSPLSIFSPWMTRRSSRKGLGKSLEWCTDRGVETFSKSQLIDFEFEGREIKGVEIKSDKKSGALSAHNFVWCLSSQETEYLLKRRSLQLFPKGSVTPQWFWVRYRVDVDLGNYDRTIPDHFVMIQDNRLTWTHDNLLVMMKTVNDQSFDVWARIPHHQRFQKSVLQRLSDQIVEKVKDRIPDSSPELTHMPQELNYSYEELGPALFPVYNPQDLKKPPIQSLSNLFGLSPETWERLDWTGRFQNDELVFQQIDQWKKGIEKKESKNDRTLHPS